MTAKRKKMTTPTEQIANDGGSLKTVLADTLAAFSRPKPKELPLLGTPDFSSLIVARNT